MTRASSGSGHYTSLCRRSEVAGRHAYTAADAAAAQLARVALDHDTREEARDHDDPGLLDLASSDSDIQLPTFATCHRAHKRAMVQ